MRTAWEQFQDGTGDDGAVLDVRSEILTSWRRSRLSGVDPVGLDVRHENVDLDTRFAHAARRILDAGTEHMADSGMCLALTDRAGRVLWSWGPDRSSRRRLAELGLLQGFRFDEETIGTNGLGTALEAGHVVSVSGEEHFKEVFHDVACVAAPVDHPLTGRSAGAVNITCRPDEVHPLLRHAVLTMVRDIRRELVAAADDRERRLFDEFLAEPARRTRPVITLDRDVLIANELASGVSVDHRLLWDGLTGAADGDRMVLPGHDRTAVVRLLSGPRGATLVLDPVTGPVHPGRTGSTETVVQRALASSRAAVLRGEPGTGKRTLARETLRRAAGAEPVEIDPEEQASGCPAAVASVLAGDSPLLLSRIDRLGPAAAAAVEAAVVGAGDLRSAVVATWDAPSMTEPGPLTPLLDTLGGPVVEVDPLRCRPAEIPALVQTLSGRSATTAALDVLQHHDWPGNLAELVHVLRSAAAVAGSTPIRSDDLPSYLRSGRRLTPLERAERDAITEVLTATGGNKTEAARRLGITRPTLYARMRTYRL